MWRSNHNSMNPLHILADAAELVYEEPASDENSDIGSDYVQAISLEEGLISPLVLGGSRPGPGYVERVIHSGRNLGSNEPIFLIEEADREYVNPDPNPDPG